MKAQILKILTLMIAGVTVYGICSVYGELQSASDKRLPPQLSSAAQLPVSQESYDFPGETSMAVNRPAPPPSKSSTFAAYLQQYPISPVTQERLTEALWKAAEKAGGVAKSMGENISEYIKEKQIEKYQQKLIENFYYYLSFDLKNLNLTRDEKESLVSRIEKIYIEDGKTGIYKLDVIQFREMPALVRKEYADMLLKKTRDGIVDTYYINGNIKTRWNLLGGKPHGVVTSYYENGEILYIDHYEHGEKIRRKKYNAEGKLEFDQSYEYEINLPAAEAPAAAAAPVTAEELPA